MADELNELSREEKRALRGKIYREKNAEKIRLYMAEYRQNNREQIRANYKKNYKDHYREKLKNQRREERIFALNFYGDHKCACCGETEYNFLAIDHKYGGGGEHSRQIHRNLARWLRVNNYPPGFRVLCHNCNFSLGTYGFCPHNPEIRPNYKYTNATQGLDPAARREEVSNLYGR